MELVCSKILPITRRSLPRCKSAASSMPPEETCTRLPVLAVRTAMWTVFLGEGRPSVRDRDLRPCMPLTAKNEALPRLIVTLPCKWKSSRCPLALDTAWHSGCVSTYSRKEPQRFSIRVFCGSYGVYRSSSKIVSTTPSGRSTRSWMHRRNLDGRGMGWWRWKTLDWQGLFIQGRWRDVTAARVRAISSLLIVLPSLTATCDRGAAKPCSPLAAASAR